MNALDAALSTRTSLIAGVLLAWFVLALATAAGARWTAQRSERTGRLLDRALGVLAPGLAGKLLRAVVGLGALGVGAVGSGLLQPATAAAAPIAPIAPETPAHGRPVTGPVTGPVAGRATALATPPTTAPATGGRHDPGDLWPLSTPARPGNTSPGKTSPGAGELPSDVVVHRGDTLWSIAARHLPPHTDSSRISAAWHRWYEHNRAVIGADPNLILPGQVLQSPF